MNKKQLEQLIDYLEKVYTYDRLCNRATQEYIDVICPWEYAPIIEWKLPSILEALKILYPEITELLEYYFHESKNMKEWGAIECDWKKYNYSNIQEVIQSMIDFWHVTN
jgi:hypothetical protein